MHQKCSKCNHTGLDKGRAVDSRRAYRCQNCGEMRGAVLKTVERKTPIPSADSAVTQLAEVAVSKAVCSWFKFTQGRKGKSVNKKQLAVMWDADAGEFVPLYTQEDIQACVKAELPVVRWNGLSYVHLVIAGNWVNVASNKPE